MMVCRLHGYYYRELGGYVFGLVDVYPRDVVGWSAKKL
jgi:hypothetical protein